MNGFVETIGAALGRLLPAPVALPVVKQIDPRKTFPEGSSGATIRRNEAYFEVRVNQMCLAKNVSWFSVYDPLVVIIVAFDYGDKRQELPFVIGPGSIERHLAAGAPLFGTVLTDAKVTGPHPYRGSGVTLSVSFYRVQRENYAKSLLKVVERLSGMVGLGQVGTLVNTADVLLDGLEGLFGAGQTVCLATHQFSLPASPAYPLQTGFSALIVPPVPATPDQLLVRDGRLFTQHANGDEAAYTDSDFVLLSITGLPRRQNENFFPCYQLKRQAMEILGEGEPSRKRAKATLLTALQQLRISDDFTAVEAELLFDEWIQEFEREVVRYQRTGALPLIPVPPPLPLLASDMNQAMARLDL